MKRFYQCRVLRHLRRRYNDAATFGVYIVSDKFCRRSPNRSEDRKYVHTVREGLDEDYGTVSKWYDYGSRIARLWNAVLLAAELVGCVCNTPSGILADKVEETGERDLAEMIRRAYCPWCYGANVGRGCDPMPDLPVGAPSHVCIIV